MPIKFIYKKILYATSLVYLKENLVHFAGYKNHIGFYPGASGIKNFEKEFDKLGFKYSKGAVQFKIDKPLPKKLIQEIVKFRINENN